MSQLIEENTNVINLDFRREQMNIEHPASKRFDNIDDPLEDLLNEFSYLDEEVAPKQRDYIAHLEGATCDKVSMDLNSLEMSEKIGARLQRAKEGISRLKYYMNELNLESL